MNITLFGLSPYDRSGKVRWLLEELKLPYTDHWLNRETREHEQKDYLKINPFGRVPALKIEEKVLVESNGICAYLADRFIEGKMAPAFDSPERAEYQQWMAFATATMEGFATRIMIIEDIPPGEVFSQKEQALVGDIKDTAEWMDQIFSKQDYLLKSGFSAADVCVSYHLYFILLWPELKAIFDQYPSIGKYIERIENRPAAKKANVFSYPG